MDLVLIRGDITQVEAQGVVNPANSLGEMGGGVAGLLRRKGGEVIEAEAMARAPIPVGSAVATSAGKLPFLRVIHAPTMERPAARTTADKVGMATRAALMCGDGEGLLSLAFPGMGTGVGRVSPGEAARTMVESAREFKPRHLRRVYFVAFEEEMYRAFAMAGVTPLDERPAKGVRIRG
jgi:O-acetyl-ADP-ribose deacetylase